MTTFRTACPVAKRTEEAFVQRVTIGGESKRFEHVKPIIWIQESESKIVFLHGGRVLREESTHTDFYGYLTSFRTGPDAVVNPEGIANAYGITRESSLELVVRTMVFLQPAYESPETIEHNRTKPTNYKPMYAHVPDDWRKEAENTLFPGELMYPRLERIELGTGIVWSSKNTPDENEALGEQFRQQWAVPEVSNGSS